MIVDMLMLTLNCDENVDQIFISTQDATGRYGNDRQYTSAVVPFNAIITMGYDLMWIDIYTSDILFKVRCRMVAGSEFNPKYHTAGVFNAFKRQWDAWLNMHYLRGGVTR